MKRFEQLTPADHIKNLSSEIASLKSKKKLSKSEMITYQQLVETFHDVSTREFQYSENHPEIRQKLLDSHGHWLEYVYNQAKARSKKILALVAGSTLFVLAVLSFLAVMAVPNFFSGNLESRVTQLERTINRQSTKIQGLEQDVSDYKSQLSEQLNMIQSLKADNQRILSSYQSLIEQMKKTREAFQMALEKSHDPR